MKHDLTVTLDLPYEKTVAEVRAALKDQGFGVLTEIDVQATMREKLDVGMEPYVILGACNPPLAHRALEADRMIGLLLPCNVVVRADGDERSVVQALDPHVLAELTEREELRPIAEEAGRRLRAVLETLTLSGDGPA